MLLIGYTEVREEYDLLEMCTYHMTDLINYKQKCEKLEHELDEMTVALSHAWDQLVPFLQELPEDTTTAQDVMPILQAISVAADTEIVGIYLFEIDFWYNVPKHIEPTKAFLSKLRLVTKEQSIEIQLLTGQMVRAAITPIVSEDEIIGVLGIGSYDMNRSFTSVDFRIINRMAQRVGSQIAVSQLAQLREREAMQAREMQIGNEIQNSVQPKSAPTIPNLKMASYWRPAEEVGGDAWGWIQQNNEHLAWFILDVAGKGLPAALAAVALHTAISMALRMKLSPVEALELVNEEFYDAYTRTDLMATAAILSINTTTGQLEIANAGHPPTLIRHQNKWLRLRATAPPIGVLPDLQVETQLFKLDPNDICICHSDGFSEIETPGKLWGQTGMLNAIPLGAKDIDSLTEHIVKTSQQVGKILDDQTLVSVIYTNR